MIEFTTTALVSKPSQVFAAAEKGGAILTRHGQREFVIISAMEYRLLKRARSNGGKGADVEGKTRKSA